jgi:hypothetical protein
MTLRPFETLHGLYSMLLLIVGQQQHICHIGHAAAAEPPRHTLNGTKTETSPGSTASDQTGLLPVQAQGLGVLWLRVGQVSIGTELGISYPNPCQPRRRSWVLIVRLNISSIHRCCCSFVTSCLSTAPLLCSGGLLLLLLLLMCVAQAHLGSEARSQERTIETIGNERV